MPRTDRVTRSKKATNENLNEVEDVHVSEEKAKRGRPRVVKVTKEEEVKLTPKKMSAKSPLKSPEKNEVKPKTRVNRRLAAKNEDINESENEEAIEEKPKQTKNTKDKKSIEEKVTRSTRGSRSKKMVESEPDEEIIENKSPKKNVRNKKVSPEENLESDVNNSKPASLKSVGSKRGRRGANKINEDIAEAEEKEMEEKPEEIVPKKRGRKPAAAKLLIVETVLETEADEKPKSKRGRKPAVKPVVAEDVNLESDHKEEPKIKRITSKTKLSNIEKEVSSEEVEGNDDASTTGKRPSRAKKGKEPEKLLTVDSKKSRTKKVIEVDIKETEETPNENLNVNEEKHKTKRVRNKIIETDLEDIEEKTEILIESEVEEKHGEAESKPEAIEPTPEEIESKPEEIESKPEEIETKPEEIKKVGRGRRVIKKKNAEEANELPQSKRSRRNKVSNEDEISEKNVHISEEKTSDTNENVETTEMPKPVTKVNKRGKKQVDQEKNDAKEDEEVETKTVVKVNRRGRNPAIKTVDEDKTDANEEEKIPNEVVKVNKRGKKAVSKVEEVVEENKVETNVDEQKEDASKIPAKINKRGRKVQSTNDEKETKPHVKKQEEIKDVKKGIKRKGTIQTDEQAPKKAAEEILPSVVDVIGDIKEQVSLSIESESMIDIYDQVTEDENFLRVSNVTPDVSSRKVELDDSLEILVGKNNKRELEEDHEQVTKKSKTVSAVHGHLMTWGEDVGGELGLKSICITRKKPTLIDSIPDPISSVVAGPMHTVCITSKGVIYTFGNNDECALGRATKDKEKEEAIPDKVPLTTKVIKVSAGDSHTAMLTALNSVYIAGNFRDQSNLIGLTPESKSSVLLPMHLDFSLNVIDIASGDNHLLLLTKEGDVYSLGVGEQGQLGRLTEDKSSFEKANDPNIFLEPKKVTMLRKCDRIWATSFSSFCRTVDGKIYAWGLNNYSQLGIARKNRGTDNNIDTIEFFPQLVPSFIIGDGNVEQIAGGPHHTLVLDSNGKIYSCGRYDYGRLGLGKTNQDELKFKLIESLNDKVTAISCGTTNSFAVTNKDKIYFWGMESPVFGNIEQDLFEPTLLEAKSLVNKNILSISSGTQHVAIIVKDQCLNGGNNHNH